ncbi:MAG: hypothetical protein KDC28_00550 [Saprospiraceae bacterium]|nr:hypothetical protein [Saprospiraceae bacterium]MCB9318842.1 hypothetical protein [Lewinellaceae bacterium]
MPQKKSLVRSDFWRSDRFIFILFVAIALLWWLLISLNRTAEKTVELPIEYQVPVGFLSDQSNPAHIQVTIRGEGWDLVRNVHRLLPASLAVTLKSVENQFLTKADLAYMLNNQFNPGSTGIHFDILDEGIRVFLVPASTRLIPLSLPKALHVPATTQLAGKLQLDPDSIVISGPVSILDTIRSWPLQLEEAISQPGPFLLTGKPYSSNYANVSVQPIQVTVRGRTDVFTEKKLKVPIATFFQDSTDQLLVQPKEIEVWCRVASYFYNDLTAKQLQVRLIPEPNSPRVGLEIKSGSDAYKVLYFYPKFVYRYHLIDRT